METHSSILAWRIPQTEEPGRLQSMGSHRVGHTCSDLALPVNCLFAVVLSFCLLTCDEYMMTEMPTVIFAHEGNLRMAARQWDDK